MLLNKIAHLHDFNIIYKYLSPRHLIITSGFQIDAPIDLYLKDITMIQLLDLLKDIPQADKTCGLNATFFAPEVVKGGAVSFKADVWGIGAVLYLMVAGSVMQRINKLKPSQ